MSKKLETLYVELEARINKYEKNLKKAQTKSKDTTNKIKKGFDKLKSPIQGVTQSLGNFKGALVAVAGAAGLSMLIKNSFEAADRIGKLSSNIGFSTDKLQELQFAASQTGVKQEDLNASLMRFNRRLSEAGNGNAAFAKSYADLGVNVRDVNSGALRPSEDVLRDVADKVSKLGNEGDQARILFTMFGDSGFRLVNMFKGGAPALDAFASRAHELGMVLDEDLIKNAEATNDKLDVMKKILSTQLSAALIQLAPLIQKAADLIVDLTASIGPLGDKVGKIGEAIINSFMGAPKSIDTVKMELEDLEKSLQNLKEPSSWYADWGRKWFKISGQLTSQEKYLNEEIQKRKALLEEMGANLIEPEKKKEAENTDAVTTPGLDLGKIEDTENEKTVAMLEYHEERLALLKEATSQYDQEAIDAEQEKIDTLYEMKTKGSDAWMKYEKKQAKQNKKDKDKLLQQDMQRINTQLNASKSFFGNMMTLSKGHSKELFAIAKAASLATAIIQGVVAVQTALANPPGPPFSIPQAAAAAAQAAVNVASIASQSFKTGIDEVPGVGNRDSVPALLQPGERITPKNTNMDLKEFLAAQKEGGGYGGQNFTVEISLKDDIMDFIDAKLIERERLGIQMEAS